MKKFICGLVASFCLFNQATAAEQPIHYLQTDSKWENVIYSSSNNRTQTIGATGCGPTSLAMVLNKYIDKDITPVEAASFSVKNNHRTRNQGTSWTLFSDAAEKYDIEFYQTASSVEAKEWMKNNPNGLIICSMKKGNWTNGGHFILLWKIDEEDNVYINDPNSIEKNRLFNNFKNLSSQCKQYFCFNKKNNLSEIYVVSKPELFNSKYKKVSNSTFIS